MKHQSGEREPGVVFKAGVPGFRALGTDVMDGCFLRT